MLQKSYTLRENICSMLKRSHVFGKAGDIVTLIAEHGDVFIVEAENNERFPARKELLNEGPKRESEAKPSEVEPTATNKKTKKPTKTKAVPFNNTNTLF